MKGRNGGNYNGENNYEKRTSPLCHALICIHRIRQVRGGIMVILWILFLGERMLGNTIMHIYKGVYEDEQN